jgi:hypothetical protein
MHPDLPRLGFPELFTILAIVLLIWWSAQPSGPRDWFR